MNARNLILVGLVAALAFGVTAGIWGYVAGVAVGRRQVPLAPQMTKGEFDRILESEKSDYAQNRAKELYQQAESLEKSDPVKALGTYNAASVAFPDTLWGKKAGDRFKSFYEQSRQAVSK